MNLEQELRKVEQRNLTEIAHINAMYLEAKADFPNLHKSAFSMYFVTHLGDAFAEYWDGNKHMPTWEQIKKDERQYNLFVTACGDYK